MNKNFLLYIGLPVLLFFVVSAGVPALAQDEDFLGVSYGAASGLGAGDPRILTVRIINVILGLLGIISVILLLYAGFTWMTSAGNEEKITTAKKTIWAAVIGIAIIMSAYTVTRFVAGSLYEATTLQRAFPEQTIFP